MAQTNRIFCRRALFNHGRRHVGVAWTGCPSYTAWPGHSGDRISMGQKVARNMPSMAARSFSKNQIEKGELIHESNGDFVHDAFEAVFVRGVQQASAWCTGAGLFHSYT